MRKLPLERRIHETITLTRVFLDDLEHVLSILKSHDLVVDIIADGFSFNTSSVAGRSKR